MDIVGFSQDEKQSLYTLLSAILNIGNVTFEAVFDKSSGHNIHDSVDLKNEKCKLSRNCVPIKLVVLSEYGYFVEKLYTGIIVAVILVVSYSLIGFPKE